MTITNTTLRNDYVANGSSTVFSFTFIVLSETAGYTIQVITTDLIGVETVKTQGVNYTVQLNDDGLGTITFITAPLLNHKITLLSNVPNTQETDYIKAGTDKFPAESHEKALDKLTLIAKQFLEKFNRIVSLPKSSTLSNIEFPINASNANQILVINSDGTNLTTANLADVGIAPVSAYAKSLLDDVNSSQARATLDAQQLNANLTALAGLTGASNLTALAGLTGASNKIPMFSGAGAMVLIDKIVPATSTTQGTTLISDPIIIANNSTDADNDINFTAGNFVFSDKSNIAVLLAMTKRLDASWTAGTNNGGLDTGSKANSTWYHCYAIHNLTSGVSDAIFSANATTPTLPSGYTKYKRVGSVRVNASGNILQFKQLNKNEFYYGADILETTALGTLNTNNFLLTTTPLGVSTKALITAKVIASTSGVDYQYTIFSPIIQGNKGVIVGAGTQADVTQVLQEGIYTDTNSRIYQNGSTYTSLANGVFTTGYIDYTL